ncbi:MAG: aspartate aminotransferase family protein [Bacteroidota bacterium]
MDFGSLQAQYMLQCWAAQAKYAPIPLEDAEGCYMITPEGRKIFDLRSSHECNNLGFKHPKVLARMKEQMEGLIYVTDDFAAKSTALLAQKLAQLSPGNPNKKVWFSQSGATAVEAAIKGARMYAYNRMMEQGHRSQDAPQQYPYPYKIIGRYRSWHGATPGAAAAGGDPRRWFQEPLSPPGFIYGPDAYCYRCPMGHSGPDVCGLACANYLEQMIELEGGSGKVAAIIVESIVGSNGIIPPPAGYFERLREICDRWDILLIIDETMTGCGRTGKMFAIEHYGIEPDILIMGKALGMYSPLAATIFSEKVAQSFDHNIFGHGQSYSGHALSCAAALAGLEVLFEERLIERSADLGQYLLTKLEALAAHHPSVGEVRGKGLFCTVEIVKNRETKASFRKHTEKYKATPISEIARFMLEEKDIYLPSDKFGIWVVPPLIVSKAEIDMIVEAVDEALLITDRFVDG